MELQRIVLSLATIVVALGSTPGSRAAEAEPLALGIAEEEFRASLKSAREAVADSSPSYR